MYLKRKIDNYLDEWLKKEEKSPLLVVGIRQCGKTKTIKEFANRQHLKLVEINFWNNPEFCSDFNGKLDVETIISNISLKFPKIIIKPENTLIFFDEIQECPRARLSLKNFEIDGHYHVIGSGPYLGINGYVIGDGTPSPIGYEDVYEMKTMNFEEFLWANGYSESQINQLVNYFKNNEPIPSNIDTIYKELFNKYISIGGFPKVVCEYIKTHNLMEAYRVLKSIIFDMKTDFGRRRNKSGETVFNKSEVSRIQNVFDLIPAFLSKDNKRFIVSKITGGTSYDKKDAIEYLTQAHIVKKVYNVNIPSLPLSGEKIQSQFKLFPEDIGIVTSMHGPETIIAINQMTLGQGKGAIYESMIFDSLNKPNVDTYYFAKESGLEVDFVISYDGFATLIESKTKNGNAKSSKTIMKHKEHYGETRLIKIGNYNISRQDNIITIPHYLTFVLGKNEYNL